MSLATPPVSSPRSSLDRVFNALEEGGYKPDKRAETFMALCPVHEDRTRSLSVRYDRHHESVLLHCFGCDAGAADVTAALGLRVQDLFDRPLPDRPRSEWAKKPARSKVAFRSPKKTPPRITQPAVTVLDGATWEQTAVYSYTDAAGTVVQEVIREQAAVDGVTHKRFTQRFMGARGNMVSRKPPKFSPVLYNHAAVLQAVAAGTPVWLVEGEKDADNATERGVVATTNAQGAGSFPEELADVLAGGVIHVVADRDLAGYKRAASLHDMLGDRGCTVRLFLPATREDKSDLTDHLEAGNGVDELIEISIEDVAALTKLAEASKTAAAISIAEKEAAANIAKADETGDDSYREHARTWAADADARFRTLDAAAGGSGLLADSYGPEGKQAVDTIRTLALLAAQVAVKAHEVADVPVPDKLRRRVTRDEPTVINIGGGNRNDPPSTYRGNDFIRGDDGSPNEGTQYIVRQGETVQVKHERRGEENTVRFLRIMRGWAEVLSTAVEDNALESSTSRGTHKITIKFSRWVRTADGKPVMVDDPDGSGQQVPEIEEAIVTWGPDELRDGSWWQKLPWGSQFLESVSRRGKDSAWDAIFSARPAPSANTTVYTAMGWRDSDAGPFFVHGGGGIAKGGSLDLDVEFPDVYRVYNMPAPTRDGDELRAAWERGTGPLIDELPPRVIAPLLGVVWESVFQRVPTITHLVGARASFKSSIARLAMQYVAPGLEHFGRKEVLSGANQGGTNIGLSRALQGLRNLPVLIDDLAPDGDAKGAQKRLSGLARMLYNGVERVTGKQRGGISMDAPLEASVITTGELSIGGSGQTRLLSIPIDPGSITGGADLMAALERTDRREARGLLGASLIQWIAQHRDQLVAENATDEAAGSLRALSAHWRKRVTGLPHDRGVLDRLAGAAASADHGIKLMLRMMVNSGAMSPARADAFNQWATDGIYEAIAMQDAESGDPAEQMLEYLREAVSSGMGHFTTPQGDHPEDAESRGWSLRGRGDFATWNANGTRLGIIKGDGADARLLLLPSVVLGAVNNVAQRADETFSETSVSVGSSLQAHGWLHSDSSGRHARPVRLGKGVIRAWDIPLAVFDGDADTGSDDPKNEPEPVTPPSLFDLPGGGEPVRPTTPTAPVDDVEDDGPTDDPNEHTTDYVDTAEPAAAAPVPTAVLPAAPSTPAAAPQRRAAATATPFRASLAVLHTDGVWLPSGECVQPSQPLVHLGDVARLVAELNLGTQNGWKTEDGQLLVTEAAALELGIPVDKIEGAFDRTKQLQELTKAHPFAQRALDAGYRVGNDGRYLNTTTRVWHPEHRQLRARFVLLSTLKDDFTAHIVDDNPDAATIARRLQRFADALRTPYAISASTTGLDLLFTTAKNRDQRETYFTPSRPVAPAEIPTLEADIDWQRKLTDTEREHRYVHAFDRGGSYLAGVSGLELGYGVPTHFTEGHEFDKKLPGYWRIVMPERAEWLTPNPIDPRNRDRDFAGELTWVTTQTLDIATALGYQPEISEAILWEQHGRIYDAWYERVRDARTTLDTADPDDQRARDLLKEVYVRSLGLTASFEHHANREGFAPERYHFIQARAKANILRRIHQIGTDTGRWPVAISKDTVIYTSDDADPVTAWPGDAKNYGRGLGQYKYEGSALLADHQQFLTGDGRYEGKSSLTDWTEGH